jgi:putative transposase
VSPVAAIEAARGELPVARLCELFGVSRSGFYASRGRSRSARARSDERMRVEIRATFKRFRGRYGSPRIAREVTAAGNKASRHRIARLMRLDGLRARPRRRFVTTTQADESATPAPNLLQRRFTAEARDTVWVTDITYIPTLEGWLFLAVVIDLYSRKVVGWATSESLKTSLATRAVQRALDARRPSPGLIHHSDRGCQYTAKAYRAVLEKSGVVQSMSRSGNCLDNAVAESFFGTFKHELDRRVFASRADAHHATAEYIDGFYNPVRRHSSIDYMAPIEFERLAREALAA